MRQAGPTWIKTLIRHLLDDAGATRNRDVLADILRNAYDLAARTPTASTSRSPATPSRRCALAFRLFAPYEGVPKVTVFGSARTHPTDPLYDQARQLARRLADAGWMVVTGAGPGIMAAATEGAGRRPSLGRHHPPPVRGGAQRAARGPTGWWR